MKNKDIKAFKGLEAVIGNDYRMLCDRVILLEKSHKRMMMILAACKIVFFEVLEKCPLDLNSFGMLARVQHVIEVLDGELKGGK